VSVCDEYVFFLSLDSESPRKLMHCVASETRRAAVRYCIPRMILHRLFLKYCKYAERAFKKFCDKN